MSANHKPALEPAILVIFGITGDLAKRYLLPSLYHLIKYDMLHDQTEIIGLTRGDMTMDELLSTIELCVSEVDGLCDPAAVNKLRDRMRIRHMDMEKPEEYDSLLEELNQIEDKHGVHMNRLYYLSIPPNVVGTTIGYLGDHGLNTSCQHGVASTRLLTEKPFGNDFNSAKELMTNIAEQFSEEQIYRIDHYLAKETVQNILDFRFNNPIFEPIWNGGHIDYIEVLANEKIGIEGRVNFYEQTGALRDLIQNHLLQVLAIVTMEQPPELTSELIHEKKLALMSSIEQIPSERLAAQSVRGQYEGYRNEVSNADSNIETFAALRLAINNDRWQNTPMIMKSGKGLNDKLSEVNVVFKPTRNNPHHNILTFRIQPHEGIKLSLRIKKPGFDDEIQPVDMKFDYDTSFHELFNPTAYERVLVDAVRGDHTLFATGGEVLESWRVVQPIIDEWAKSSGTLAGYNRGSDGPDTTKLYPQ